MTKCPNFDLLTKCIIFISNYYGIKKFLGRCVQSSWSCNFCDFLLIPSAKLWTQLCYTILQMALLTCSALERQDR